jgi:hypothetical protein
MYSLVGLRLVDLLTMHHQTSGRVQLSWTMPTLEVFRLLMLQENYSVQVAESCQFEVDVQDNWI